MKHSAENGMPSAPPVRARQDYPDRASVLEVAASATTPPKSLVALSKTGDAEVAELIAANPNTPIKTLHKLWLLHPRCVLENPILLYWSLREGKPAHALLPIEVKLTLYLELRKQGDMRALEVHLPEDERLRWLSHPFSDARRTHGASNNRARQVSVNTFQVRGGIETSDAAKGRCTGVYKLLASDPSAAVRGRLAKGVDSIPFTPAERRELLQLLAVDASAGVRSEVASSLHLTAALHLQFSEDPAFEVRSALARNPTSLEEHCLVGWRRLLAAGHGEQIALNPACPEAFKLELIALGSPMQRRHAWAGFRFHETSSWKMVNLEIDMVLADPKRLPELIEIARNKTIGGSLKGRLASHPEVRVTRALATQPHLTEQQRLVLLFHSDHKTALRAAKHAPAADFLDIASAHPSPWVRALLAKKTGDKTWSLRAKLVHDSDPRVRIALCRGLPESRSYNGPGKAVIDAVRSSYPSDPSPRVRLVAKKHPLLAWKRPSKRRLP